VLVGAFGMRAASAFGDMAIMLSRSSSSWDRFFLVPQHAVIASNTTKGTENASNSATILTESIVHHIKSLYRQRQHVS
jgi:hypothetical protein